MTGDFGMKKRLFYLIATVLLIAIEVLIALYVHDSFVRPYVGDVLVVIVLYTFVRIFLPDGCRLLPLWVFLFAACVEGLQAIHITEKLGLADNRFAGVLIGGTFDIHDILCYAIGCVAVFITEILLRRRKMP